jgi:hypothetical protein
LRELVWCEARLLLGLSCLCRGLDLREKYIGQTQARDRSARLRALGDCELVGGSAIGSELVAVERGVETAAVEQFAWVRVGSVEEAQARRFLGSPTLRVDGADVEPGADERTDYGLKCRLYRDATRLAGSPGSAWIVSALEGAGSGREDRRAARATQARRRAAP